MEAPGGFFATTSGGVIAHFHAENQKRLQEFKVVSETGAEAPTISSCACWETLLAVGTLDGRVIIFDTETGGQRTIFVAKP